MLSLPCLLPARRLPPPSTRTWQVVWKVLRNGNRWATSACDYALDDALLRQLVLLKVCNDEMRLQVNSIITITCFGLYAGTTMLVNYFLVATWLPATLIVLFRYVDPRWERVCIEKCEENSSLLRYNNRRQAFACLSCASSTFVTMKDANESTQGSTTAWMTFVLQSHWLISTNTLMKW